MTSMKIVMMVKRRSNASGILNMVWEPLRLREAPCAPCSAATPCEATPMPGCACSAISSARADAVRSSRSARFCCSLASGSADATMPADATWSAARLGTGASACAAHTRSAASIGYVDAPRRAVPRLPTRRVSLGSPPLRPRGSFQRSSCPSRSPFYTVNTPARYATCCATTRRPLGIGAPRCATPRPPLASAAAGRAPG